MQGSKLEWFKQSKYGLFIHWGPYSIYGKGEQILLRDHIKQSEYEAKACEWNPRGFDANQLADWALECGFKYAVFTSRHHDGYCLWDSQLTDYTSAQQAPKRDFIREYVDAFRSRGIKVGIYYSLMDWRIPAYWKGPQLDAAGWNEFASYVHEQVAELMSHYGKIDIIWFDAAWPHGAKEWRSFQLEERIRALQPDIIINNRLWGQTREMKANFGDFGTPEREIVHSNQRPWEACHITYWRVWGYSKGERVRSAETLLDMLCESVSRGGNLLLNVGPDQDGQIEPAIQQNLLQIGEWLKQNGAAIYNVEEGDITEFVVNGWQTKRGNKLYLICRFWHGDEIRLPGLKTEVTSAQLIGSAESLTITKENECVILKDLPENVDTSLFPVIEVTLDGPIDFYEWAKDRFWFGDPSRYAGWAAERGNSVWLEDKK